MTPTQQSLIDDVPKFSEDEASFMAEVHERVLSVGRSRYQPWVALTDKRAIPRERDEEIFDAVIYAAMLVVKRKRERAERLRCFKADEEFLSEAATTVKAQATFDVSDVGDVLEVLT